SLSVQSPSTSASTAAWLCSMSLVAVTNVRRLPFTLARRSDSAARPSSVASSSRYREANSSNFSGSCPYHLRSSEEGATSLFQASMWASSLRMPRGHTRSTRTRVPSLWPGSSYIRFSTIFIPSDIHPTTCVGEDAPVGIHFVVTKQQESGFQPD